MTHPYNPIYLDEIVETQGILFERLQDEHPESDGADFMRAYMSGATRAALDCGDAYLATLGPDLLMRYFIETEHYRFRPGEAVRGFAPNWIGQFYALYQWEQGVSSDRLCREITVDWLRCAYTGLHDLPLEAAVAKVAEQVASASFGDVKAVGK